jgi:hypothetical protein
MWVREAVASISAVDVGTSSAYMGGMHARQRKPETVSEPALSDKDKAEILAAVKRLVAETRGPTRDECHALGRTLIHNLFRNEGMEFSEAALKPMLECFDLTSVDDLYLAMGAGLFPAYHMFDDVFYNLPASNNRKVVASPPNYRGLAREYYRSFLETKLRYNTGAPPSSSPADTRQEGMRGDLNTKVKKAKAENLARGRSRPSTHQLATYRALLQHVDLLNTELPADERLRRARRLVQAYGRVRARRPKFHDKHEQLRAAFSIMNDAQYQRYTKPKRAVQKAAKVALAM